MQLDNGTIISVKIGSGFSTQTQYWMAAEKGFRRIVITTHNRGIAQFSLTDDYRASFDNEFDDANSVYAAPKSSQGLFTPVQITALKDGTTIRLSSGRTAVKNGDGYEIDGEFQPYDTITNPERIRIIDEDAILPASTDNDLGTKSSDKSMKPKANLGLPQKKDGVLTEESSLTATLHHMLSNIDISDDDLRSGVRLSENGFAKVGRKLGISKQQAEALFSALVQSLRHTVNESIKGRYSYEKDFLGNITLRDAETNKSVFLRGNSATSLLNALNGGGDEQEIMAQYASKITESWDDDQEHGKALEKTGFWGKAGAGCIILAQDTGRMLIAHRSKHVEQPLTWGTWGGAIDSGENPVESVRREVGEETGYNGSIIDIKPLYVFKSGTFRYFNFLVIIESEFKPRLDWENCGYQWCSFDDRSQWPSPLHFGLTAILKDPASLKTLEAASTFPITETAENAPVFSGGGSYNFPWKVGTRRGFATASFSGGPGDVQVKVIDIRDSNGDETDATELADEIQKQAIAFIGKE